MKNERAPDVNTLETEPSTGNGQARAAEAVVRLERYLEQTGKNVPTRHGTLNLSAICKAIGVGRSTANQNPTFRARLEAYAIEIGLADSARGTIDATGDPQSLDGKVDTTKGRDDQSPDEAGPLRKRVQALEARVHELTARNGDLLKRNADLQARLNNALLMEHVLSIKGGRR